MSENSALEASAVAISQKVTPLTGIGSFVGFAAKIDVIAWGGLIIAVIGLVIQFYFAFQRNRREKIEHEMRKAEYDLRLKNLKGECDVKQN
ncbi:holin [Acinetobacter venetianus]|uniref:Holin n=1 Tax=Acinetobacter venetianus TaxID=52133 RepID=A0A150HY20_9GAMM|nr:holin [Acinetobacter venetianus]KXZ72120.1 hypothetical protein AVENLUH13518_00731 [Acinetobacter venetianus]MCR4530228.1 holin [Acinetobacter venetianus]